MLNSATSVSLFCLKKHYNLKQTLKSNVMQPKKRHKLSHIKQTCSQFSMNRVNLVHVVGYARLNMDEIRHTVHRQHVKRLYLMLYIFLPSNLELPMTKYVQFTEPIQCNRAQSTRSLNSQFMILSGLHYFPKYYTREHFQKLKLKLLLINKTTNSECMVDTEELSSQQLAQWTTKHHRPVYQCSTAVYIR